MTRLRVRDMGTALFWPTSGTSNYVDLGSTDFSLGDNMTFACWVKNTTGVQGSLWGCNNASNEFQIDMRSANSFMAFVNGVQLAQSPSNSWALGTWVHVVYTRNGAGATHQFYINGSLATTAQLNTGSYASTASRKTIGARSTTTSPHHGCMDEVAVWSRTLSAEEIASLYTTGVPPTNSLQGFWKFDEATGTTTADSSGNGRNGTLSTITFTADVPLKPRKILNDNLVKNGDFEYAPPFTAAQTATNWLDGTAAGSATNNLFGWNVAAMPANATVQFDSTIASSGTHSIKLNKTSGGAASVGVNSVFSTNLASLTLLEQRTNAYQVLPNTSYTLTFKYKTASKAGGTLQVYRDEFTGSSTSRISYTSMLTDASTGDLDWVEVTNTFTTTATTTKLALEFIWENATTGAVWFDDIVLRPTTPLEVR